MQSTERTTNISSGTFYSLTGSLTNFVWQSKELQQLPNIHGLVCAKGCSCSLPFKEHLISLPNLEQQLYYNRRLFFVTVLLLRLSLHAYRVSRVCSSIRRLFHAKHMNHLLLSCKTIVASTHSFYRLFLKHSYTSGSYCTAFNINRRISRNLKCLPKWL